MFFRTLLLSLAAAVLTAAPHAASAGEIAGFGDSFVLPTGEPWVLPEGIELVTTIRSYNPLDPETCKRPDEETPKQLGIPTGQVRVCLQFLNTDQRRPIDVQLPPGLVVISESQKNQNGLVVQQVTLEVPSSEYLFAPILADCLNSSRSAPGIGDLYRIGPVTDVPDIQEALRLLADKDLSDPFDSAEASNVLKPLYLGKPLTKDGRDRIAALPLR